MELLHILILNRMEQRITWAIPTAAKVFTSYVKIKGGNIIPVLRFKLSVLSALPGAYYNIIRVPPTKEAEDETLEGTTVLCTIPAEDKTKPSYYHSFGQSKICCFNLIYNFPFGFCF